MEIKKRALGKGLEQLFNNENLDLSSVEEKIYQNINSEEIVEIELSEVRPNPYQPRLVFDEDALNDLAESIKEHGVFQPIIVKKSIKGYEIIAGERRVRASRKIGLDKIPAIIRNFTDEQMMEIALLENLQRENLTAIEEAIAYKNMIETLKLTQEELSKKVGKSRSHITNIIGLLNLPEEVQNMISNKELTMGHARALSKLEDQEEMKNIARRIIEDKIPVRGLEEKINNESYEKRNKFERKTVDNKYRFVEDIMIDKLDTKVKIKENKILINFANDADLNRILEILDIKE